MARAERKPTASLRRRRCARPAKLSSTQNLPQTGIAGDLSRSARVLFRLDCHLMMILWWYLGLDLIVRSVAGA